MLESLPQDGGKLVVGENLSLEEEAAKRPSQQRRVIIADLNVDPPESDVDCALATTPQSVPRCLCLFVFIKVSLLLLHSRRFLVVS